MAYYNPEEIENIKESVEYCAEHFFDTKIDASKFLSTGSLTDITRIDNMLYTIGRCCEGLRESTPSQIKQHACDVVMGLNYAAIFKNEGRDAFEKRIKLLFEQAVKMNINPYYLIHASILLGCTDKDLKNIHKNLKMLYVKCLNDGRYVVEYPVFDDKSIAAIIEKLPKLIFASSQELGKTVVFVLKKYLKTYCRGSAVEGELAFANKNEMQKFSAWLERNAKLLSVNPEKVHEIYIKLHFDSFFVSDLVDQGIKYFTELDSLFDDPIFCYVIDKMPVDKVAENAKQNIETIVCNLNSDKTMQLIARNPFVLCFEHVKFANLIQNLVYFGQDCVEEFCKQGMSLFVDKTKKFNINEVLDYSQDEILKKIVEANKAKGQKPNEVSNGNASVKTSDKNKTN